MIYTVTFNPAIDYVMRTDELQFGQTNRSLHEELYFGGKGINVSTVLSHLGFESTALGFIAGFTGEALEKGIAAQGIRTDFIRLSEGCTRINVKLKGALETEINAQGPSIDADALTKLYAQLEKLTADDTLVLAGSVPQTLPSDIYETIVAKLAPRGVRCIVDATGSLLTNVLKYHPFLIKPNRSELEEIMKKPLPTDLDIQRAARHMQEAGAVNVLVSLGKDGALLLDEHGQVHRQPAFSGHVLNTVGSGDSMVAGFIAGLARGYEYALRLGTAAGSATAFAKGLATREEIQALL